MSIFLVDKPVVNAFQCLTYKVLYQDVCNIHMTERGSSVQPAILNHVSLPNATIQVVDVVPEVQSVSILASAGESFFLSFLEQNITVDVGSDTTASIQTSLEALLTVSTSWN